MYCAIHIRAYGEQYPVCHNHKNNRKAGAPFPPKVKALGFPRRDFYEKFRVNNSKVRIGYAGEALSTTKLVFSFPDDEVYSVDDYTEMIVSRKHELDFSVLPIHFILVGLDSQRRMSIVALSSKSNFAIDKVQPSDGYVGYKAALPFATQPVQAKLILAIEDIISKSHTTTELKNGMVSLITYISQNDMTVNSNIRGSEVILYE